MWTFFVIHLDLSNSSNFMLIYAKILKSSDHLDIVHVDA